RSNSMAVMAGGWARPAVRRRRRDRDVVVLQIALIVGQPAAQRWRHAVARSEEIVRSDVDDCVGRIALAQQRVPMGQLVVAKGTAPTFELLQLIECARCLRLALLVSSRTPISTKPLLNDARVRSASCATTVVFCGF